MAIEHICPCTEGCPLNKAMAAIGGKWTMSLICSLYHDGPTRFNDLKKKLSGISNTMLSACLKDLEESGLISRREYPEVPIRVEYSVTELGKSLAPILTDLAKWGTTLK